MHLNVRVGALRLWPAGQREGGDGAPPRGLRPTGVAVQASIFWADFKEQGDADMQKVHLRRGSRNRRVRSHHGTWGLRQWMIGCSTIAFTPAPMWQVLLLGSHALAGVIPGRSRRSLSSRCRCLSPLGVRTMGAAATSLAPSATTGTGG